MKWKFFLVLIVIAFVIPIALIYLGIVTLDVGTMLLICEDTLLLIFKETSSILSILIMIVGDPIKNLEKANNLPAYLQNFGLALLAILVPLAISITTEIYRKKEHPSEDFAELDLPVILDDIFRIKRLLIYSLSMFLPYMVWDISSGTFRLLEIFISISGIYLTFRTVIDVYSVSYTHLTLPTTPYV